MLIMALSWHGNGTIKTKNIINFTHRTLKALPNAKENKRDVYHDSQTPRLNLIITDKGTKTFYLRKAINGTTRRIRLGTFPEITVENARDLAHEVKTSIAKGQDPHKQQQDARNEPTLSAFFEVYMEKHAKVHKKTSDADRTIFDCHLYDTLGKKKLSTITRDDIRALHLRIGETAKYSANRVLSLIRIIFNKAIEWEYYKQENPALYIKPFKEQSRERFLQKDELPRFFNALDDEMNQDMKDYIWMSILTGARKSNVLSMQWDAINFERKEWLIEDSKNGTPYTVPLVDAVIEILEARKRFKVNPYVFHGRGEKGHMVEPKRAWKRILERAEIKNLRLHDLRRTLGSYQAATGTSLNIIGKSLGQKSLTATQIYARLDLDPLRDSINKATDLILQHKGEKDDINN